MGEYFDWVNVNKREYISPGDFDYDNRFHGSLHKNNPVLRALYELLSGRWKGDPVVFLGDEAKFRRIRPMVCSTICLDKPEQDTTMISFAKTTAMFPACFVMQKKRCAKESTTTYMTSKTEARLNMPMSMALTYADHLPACFP